MSFAFLQLTLRVAKLKWSYSAPAIKNIYFQPEKKQKSWLFSQLTLQATGIFFKTKKRHFTSDPL